MFSPFIFYLQKSRLLWTCEEHNLKCSFVNHIATRTFKQPLHCCCELFSSPYGAILKKKKKPCEPLEVWRVYFEQKLKIFIFLKGLWLGLKNVWLENNWNWTKISNFIQKKVLENTFSFILLVPHNTYWRGSQNLHTFLSQEGNTHTHKLKDIWIF